MSSDRTTSTEDRPRMNAAMSCSDFSLLMENLLMLLMRIGGGINDVSL